MLNKSKETTALYAAILCVQKAAIEEREKTAMEKGQIPKPASRTFANIRTKAKTAVYDTALLGTV